jgi:acyl-CoA thioester hydrolase
MPTVEQISRLPVTMRDVVRPEWIDVMGHMNVVWYTHVFSNAVGGLLQMLGTTREDYLSGRIGNAALEGHVRYLRELHVGDPLRIHSRLLAISEKRLHSIHFLIDEADERLAATSEGVGAYFDLKARRMVPMPPDVAERARRILAEHAAVGWAAPVTGAMAP